MQFPLCHAEFPDARLRLGPEVLYRLRLIASLTVIPEMPQALSGIVTDAGADAIN